MLTTTRRCMEFALESRRQSYSSRYLMWLECGVAHCMEATLLSILVKDMHLIGTLNAHLFCSSLCNHTARLLSPISHFPEEKSML